MLMGEFNHNVDSKNRIIIPSKLRESLGEAVIISKGLDGCLYIYPESEWKVFEEKLKSLPMTNKNARAFVRFFYSGATEINPDKSGRALIPKSLMEYANIKTEVVSVGMIDKVEIWSKEKWEEYNDSENNMDEIAEQMNELGI
ncbi:MAG: division/cell wall cluster transcriptional repressor MraZ [Clostridium sp.]|nr:division/cell wall cluster transcriptional repressor MraZ [Clostridium sp.]